MRSEERTMIVRRLLAASIALVVLSGGALGAARSDGRVDVKLVADEAEAVLAILARRRAGHAVVDADWQRLFASEGYVRLKSREAAMQRAFDDASFREFVLSDDLAARAADLEAALARWKRIDPASAARRALAYLPSDARVRATIYPSIKPRDNSFVFEVKTNPAIFLYLDPAVTAEKFENTLAHELHHIGFGTCCPSQDAMAAIEKLPEGARNALDWVAAFGEGLAMLAAAGGPDVHPHATSPEEDRTRWDADVDRFDENLRTVERFLLDVANGRIDEAKARETGFSFYGIQGPWYTVGWRMAATIEKTFGRKRLIACMRDSRLLLATYDEAARRHNAKSAKPLALWSPELLDALRGKLASRTP